MSIIVPAGVTVSMVTSSSPLAAPGTGFSRTLRTQLKTVVLTLMMYLTPIFYPMGILPEQYRWVVRYNPVRSILEVFRDPIYYGKIPPAQHLAVCAGVALALLAVGALSFRRSSDRIPFYI